MKVTSTFCFLFLLLVSVAVGLPTPQEDSAQEKVDESRFEVESVESNSVKDAGGEDDSATDGPDLLGGLFGFLRGAIEHVQDIAEDENVAATVGGLLEAGANATGTLLAAGGELLSSAPQVLERSNGIREGLVKATDDSQPILKKNLKELERFGELFSSFLRQYTDVAIKNLQQFLEVYDRRFKCHSVCKEKSGEARELCDQLYCDGFDAEYFEFDEDLDYLVETYGDLDELEHEELAERTKGSIKPRVGSKEEEKEAEEDI